MFFVPLTMAYEPRSVNNNLFGIGIINHSDLEDVRNLVNVNGGDWGYVKVVITEKQRNKELWQKFMDDCRKYRLIPIVRIASEFKESNWEIPNIDNIDSWINFFNSLNWVVENKYIIIGNEPNHAKEWGGTIDPAGYAIYLKTFAERLHNVNSGYFVINAGFDQDAPNSKNTMDEKKYIEQMIKKVPNVFDSIDGFASHSYPNPGFSGSKNGSGRRSIRGYIWELDYLRFLGVNKDFPIFITETGWLRNKHNTPEKIADNFVYAYENVWKKDRRVVAVTPFILNYQNEPFYEFSWKKQDGTYFTVYDKIREVKKEKGEPIQKISGEIIFTFLNPLMVKNSRQNGYVILKNTGQAIWEQSQSTIKNDIKSEIIVSDLRFENIMPFNRGLVTFSLKAPNESNVFNVNIGIYVKGVRIGDTYNGKIITF